MKPVEKEEIVKAFYYGNKLVPLSKAYEEQLLHQTPKCMKVICFTDRQKIPRHFFMKDTEMVLPGSENPHDKSGLNSLIQACIDLGKVMVVRYVYREKSGPKLCVMYPHQTLVKTNHKIMKKKRGKIPLIDIRPAREPFLFSGRIAFSLLWNYR